MIRFSTFIVGLLADLAIDVEPQAVRFVEIELVLVDSGFTWLINTVTSWSIQLNRSCRLRANI
jgi:hypothetical protein